MKRKYLWLLVSLLSLTGCNSGKNASDETSSEESVISVSSEKEYPLVFGKEIDKIINEEFPALIPGVTKGTVISYTYKTDTYNDPTLFIYMNVGEDISEALDDYYTLCSSNGFTVSSAVKREYDDSYTSYYEYTVYYADIVVGEVGMELQFLEGAKDGTECMGIYAFTYPYYDKNSWPSTVVNKLIGKDIPHLPEENYTYDAYLYNNSDGNVGVIVVDGTSYDDFETYASFLKAAGFILSDLKTDEDNGNEYYYAYDHDFTVGVRFYYDMESYYALTIEIYPIVLPTNGTTSEAE